MVVTAGGFTVDLNEETMEDRRKAPRRRQSDLERTIQENVARLGLETNPVPDRNTSLDNRSDLGDSRMQIEYEAFLTDPRRI